MFPFLSELMCFRLCTGNFSIFSPGLLPFLQDRVVQGIPPDYAVSADFRILTDWPSSNKKKWRRVC